MVGWELKLLSSSNVSKGIEESHCQVGLSPAVIEEYHLSFPWSVWTFLAVKNPLAGITQQKPHNFWVGVGVWGFATQLHKEVVLGRLKVQKYDYFSYLHSGL